MSILWWLYNRHFKHQPLSAPAKMDEMQSKSSAGSFRTCAWYGNKMVFLHVSVYEDSTVPTLGTDLATHFFPENAKKLESSTGDSTCLKRKQALKFVEKEGKKNGQMNFKSKGSLHSQNSSHLQGCLSRGCSVKIPNAIPISDLLRQTLGQLVLLLNIILQSTTHNIMGSGTYRTSSC